MRLIYPADGKTLHNPLMRPHTGSGIRLVKRTFMLVYHNAVLFQCLIAVTVKFSGKQPFPGSKGVCGIHDNQIVGILCLPDVFQAVLIIYPNPLLRQPGGCKGKELLADLYDLFINFHQVYLFNFRVFHKLPDNASVPGTDYQYLFYVGMYCHGNMHHHFMINKFVLLGQHHIAIQRQKPPELRGLKYINPLKVAFPAVKLPVYPYGQLHIFRMRLRKP